MFELKMSLLTVKWINGESDSKVIEGNLEGMDKSIKSTA